MYNVTYQQQMHRMYCIQQRQMENPACKYTEYSDE